MTSGWRLLRPFTALAVLALLVWQVGHGPFVEGVTALEPGTVLAGVLLMVPATLAGAWRWRVVTRALGAPVDVPTAVTACWTSQFLNSTLPAGVAGDVHRGLRHAPADDRLLGLRAVAWERVGGQLVQVAVAWGALLVLPSSLVSSLPWASPIALPLAALMVAGAVAVVAWTSRRPSLRSDVARLRAARVLHTVVGTSLVAQGCFVAVGVVAARAVGVTAPVSHLVPLLLVMLVAMALPLGVAGWGPREGAAAWCFATAGLGADAGVATAVAYGVLATVASLPGAVVLLRSGRRAPSRLAEAGSRA